MSRFLLLWAILVWASLSLIGRGAAAQDLPVAHVKQVLEGWTVHVDSRLLEGADADLGQKALALLRARLADVVTVVPADKVARLREVPLWLDLHCGALTSMQYHPSADWLKEKGYSAEMAKAVHIPEAAHFVAARHQQVQPWCVLHELAHAYHDQVLGFEHAQIKDCWQRYVDSKHGEKALHVNGRIVRHYALTNQKEFFAEMTEAYFGVNDFFPFVSGELRRDEPDIYALLREIWGKNALE